MDNGNSSNMVMPVSPFYSGFGGGNNGGGFGFGGDSGWLFLIILLALGGGWGFGNGGGFGGGMMGGMMGGMLDLYPWMNNSNQIHDGFRDQMINENITSIRDGLNNIPTQLCSGFAGVTAAITGAQNSLAQQMYTNTIADMERSFGIQNAITDCCCKTQSGLGDVRYSIATEACATRTADATNTRDIIESQTRGTQAILDKLCALELDGVKGQLAQAQRENVGLQNQLNMATLRESQTAQNAFIQAGFTNEIDALYNRLSNCPVPTVPVYGRQPIFSCQNNGCGCGMAA